MHFYRFQNPQIQKSKAFLNSVSNSESIFSKKCDINRLDGAPLVAVNSNYSKNLNRNIANN